MNFRKGGTSKATISSIMCLIKSLNYPESGNRLKVFLSKMLQKMPRELVYHELFGECHMQF